MTTRNFPEKAKTILKGLGFQITDNTVTAPFRRGPEDINIPEDITEEVARIRGYEHIENIPTQTTITNETFSGIVEIMRTTEETLVNKCRFSQGETYPRVSEKQVTPLLKGGSPDNCRDGGSNELLELQNPVNPECPLLRDSLIYQFLGIINKNAKFFDEIRIFDTGKIWTTGSPLLGEREPKAEEGLNTQYAKSHINEQTHTGLIIYKKATTQRNEDSLLEAKTHIEIVLSALGLNGKITYQPTQHSYFHPKKQADIFYQEKTTQNMRGDVWNYVKIWFLGSFHPLILKNNKINETANTCYVELFLTTIEEIKQQPTETTYHYETIQDQIIRRDLCFVLDIDKNYSELLNRIQSLPEIKEVKVFDLYQWTNLPEGKKSISIQIKLLGDGNMTTEQINEIMNKAIKKAESVGAELRE